MADNYTKIQKPFYQRKYDLLSSRIYIQKKHTAGLFIFIFLFEKQST